VATGVLTTATVSLAIGVLAVPISALIPCIVVAGFAWGCTTPSRDMLVRGAAPAGATGTVFGFVYSGPRPGLCGDAVLPRFAPRPSPFASYFRLYRRLLAITAAFVVGHKGAGRRSAPPRSLAASVRDAVARPSSDRVERTALLLLTCRRPMAGRSAKSLPASVGASRNWACKADAFACVHQLRGRAGFVLCCCYGDAPSMALSD